MVEALILYADFYKILPVAPASCAYDARMIDLRGRRHLTSRERQIVDLLIAGDDVDAIAAKLAIAPGTVHDYTRKISAKCGIASMDKFQTMMQQLGSVRRA